MNEKNKAHWIKKHIDYKVPNGKFLRIDLELEGKVIKTIRINGDFFVYPEKGIFLIEKSLIDKKIDDVSDVFNKTINKENIKVIGFKGDDLALAFSKIAEK